MRGSTAQAGAVLDDRIVVRCPRCGDTFRASTPEGARAVPVAGDASAPRLTIRSEDSVECPYNYCRWSVPLRYLERDVSAGRVWETHHPVALPAPGERTRPRWSLQRSLRSFAETCNALADAYLFVASITWKRPRAILLVGVPIALLAALGGGDSDVRGLLIVAAFIGSVALMLAALALVLKLPTLVLDRMDRRRSR